MRTLLMVLIGLALCLGARAATPPGTNVLTYHGDPQRSGNYIVPGLTWKATETMHRDAGFDGTVEGPVYAQPLYWRAGQRGEIIVATESDVVQALDAISGRTIWRVVLGHPVPRAAMPCGNINPLGITGTPVIEAASGAIYLDAMVDRDGVPAHLVFGLSLHNGGVLPGWPVDVQAALRAHAVSFIPRFQNQRAALGLLNRRVYIAYSGHFGDCGPYHGIVLGLDVNPPHATVVWSTRGPKGGIWAPGGISADRGFLFMTTGNTETGESWADGEGVFRLAPDLAHSLNPRDFYAPRNWKQLDDEDLDMSGVSPLPFDVGDAARLLALGKDGNAYLLNRDNLGGIGGQILTQPVAGIPIITAPAAFPAPGREVVVFRAPDPVCPAGESGRVVALAVTASSVAPLWCARLDGRGSAIVTTTDGAAQPVVWIAGAEGDDRLRAFRGDIGAPLWVSRQALPGLRHFVTPMMAGDRLYIAGDRRVYAFVWGR